MLLVIPCLLLALSTAVAFMFLVVLFVTAQTSETRNIGSSIKDSNSLLDQMGGLPSFGLLPRPPGPLHVGDARGIDFDKAAGLLKGTLGNLKAALLEFSALPSKAGGVWDQPKGVPSTGTGVPSTQHHAAII